MMKKEWVTFRDPKELVEGKEMVLAIKDLTPGPRKYDTRIVRARVSSSPDSLPDHDKLWVRSLVGRLETVQPWAIKIVEDLPEVYQGPPFANPKEVLSRQ
ncbi:phenylphosphate carboxylase subunit gamma [Chloroflexota bacterium]